jgi:hypothetical protein
MKDPKGIKPETSLSETLRHNYLSVREVQIESEPYHIHDPKTHNILNPAYAEDFPENAILFKHFTGVAKGLRDTPENRKAIQYMARLHDVSITWIERGRN